jgi:hypothetical protein
MSKEKGRVGSSFWLYVRAAMIVLIFIYIILLAVFYRQNAAGIPRTGGGSLVVPWGIITLFTSFYIFYEYNRVQQAKHRQRREDRQDRSRQLLDNIYRASKKKEAQGEE